MTKKGFSLVELMVTVSIIAIISTGAMGSFYILGDILRVKQGAGLIQDMIHQADQQALRGEYKKITIHFERDYLVMEYEPEFAKLDLRWTGSLLSIGNDGFLEKQDDRKTLQTQPVTTAMTVDPINPPSIPPFDPSNPSDGDRKTHFLFARETDWRYQLNNDDKVSSVISLKHFNINRESKSVETNALLLEGVSDEKLVIEAPYAAHRLYRGGQVVSSLSLTLRDTKNRKRETFELR